MSGISFGCIVWCPSTSNSFSGLESFPLGDNGLFHLFIPPPGFTTPMVVPELCHTPPQLSWAVLSWCCSIYPQWPHQLHLQMCSHASWRPLGNDCLSEGLSFQTLRWGVTLGLDFGSTPILMSHTRSWCCWATSSPEITFTSVTSLRMVLWKRMKSICVVMFPDLSVMGRLSRFLKHVYLRSRSNARAYSRILSPSTSGSGLLYPILPCTSLYPVPAWPTWPFQSPHGIRNSDTGILTVTARKWSKNRSLTSSLRPLCGAYIDRKVTTRWPTINFTKMILSETLCTSKTLSTLPPKTLLRHQCLCHFLTSRTCTWCPCPWLCGSCHHDMQTSTFLQDSVCTTSQTLPFRVFTLSVPTLNFLRCLLDSPQWPDPASYTWQVAKPETLPTELWCLLAPPISCSILVLAMKDFGTTVFTGSPILADHYQELSYYRNCHSDYRYSILDRLRLIPFDQRPVSVVLPV